MSTKKSIETRKTKFEISDEDFDRLARIQGSDKFNQMNQLEWLNYKIKMEDVVYNFLKGSTAKINDIKKDQRKRAEKIIEDLLNVNPKIIYSFNGDTQEVKTIERRKSEDKVGTVILMDGHGRLVWQLLNYWYNVKKREDTLKLVVIEYNKRNHEFHEKMFPKDITCALGNVFTKELYRYRTPDGNFIECDPSQMVVYFNFTSIEDQGNILYERLASNAYDGISTHWSYMSQIIVKRSNQNLKSTLLVNTHNFIKDFRHFYGHLEGKKFMSYPVDYYSTRSYFDSFRLDFHTNRKCLKFNIATLMNNCRQFERDLVRNNYKNLEKILSSKNKKKNKIGQLKKTLKNKGTSIAKGMRDLCSLNIYKLKCADKTVSCGSSEWQFGSQIEAELFLFIMKWVFHGMYYRYKENMIVNDDDDEYVLKDEIHKQILDVFQSITYRIVNHITKGTGLRSIYSKLMKQRSWGNSPLGDNFLWIRDDDDDGPFVSKSNYTIVDNTDWQQDEGGESKTSEIVDSLTETFSNLRF